MVIKSLTVIAVFAALAAAYLAGYLAHSSPSLKSGAASRKILYYVDPMHPSYRSDKPGSAPDCGMPLEPVYADGLPAGEGESGASATLPPGTIRVSQEGQQLIGVKLAQVEKAPWSQTVRVLGRVAPDENRLYRVNASTELWIRKVHPPASGDYVKRNTELLSYYTTSFISAAGSYIYALGTLDRLKDAKSPEQEATINYQVRQAVEALQNLGVSDTQIAEMARSRKIGNLVDVRSPSDGVILSRNATLAQWVPPGTELYRIADLSRVWILADVYEGEGGLFSPGMQVRVTHPILKKQFSATVSNAQPLFDPVSRTLKVRLLADNPGYALRPDMFVDLEVPKSGSAAVTIPREALLDSGLKKTVFVEREKGIFEPRQVETGRSLGNRVEIVSGLEIGEAIAVSGTFMLDSESRMKSAASGITGTARKDPVCGMYVDEAKARAAGNFLAAGGTTSYFCSSDCKEQFLRKTPARAKTPAESQGGPGMPVLPAALRHDPGRRHD